MDWLIIGAEQIAGCLIGVAVGFFGVAQPVMVLFLYIPWTLSSRREGALRSLAPLRRYLFAITYLLAFLIFASWLLLRFAAPLLPGYVLGLAFTLVKGIRRCGRKHKIPNMTEYLKMNMQDFDPTYVAQVFGMESTSVSHTETPNQETERTTPPSDA
jgi:hypothetical protein